MMKRKHQRQWLTGLLVLCMGVILVGGLQYVTDLRKSLTDQAVANVMTVTKQQQQALDNFITGDQERLHSFADYFAKNASGDMENIQSQLKAFGEVDAFYTVIDLYSGNFCSNKFDEVFHLEGEELQTYRKLPNSGVRDPFTGLYSDDAMFGYYERFIFADGIQGLIQKSYDLSKVSADFSLSFYNDQGLAYVVNQKGDILLHSIGLIDTVRHDSILELIGGNDAQEEIDSFMAALAAQESGSMVFPGKTGNYIYTYVPVESVKEWSLVSIVPEAAITEETDAILLQSQLALLILVLVLVVSGIFVILIWRTQRDIAQKDREIRYQEELFNIFSTYLANNTDDVYMMFDLAEDRMEYASPNVERVLGVSVEQLKADLRKYHNSEFSSGDKIDLEDLRRMVPGEALDYLETQWINPITREHKSFRVGVYCTSVQEENRIVVYISDRTRERKAQDNLSEALNLAEVANNAKSSFLSSVSHDIRTPMNAIIGFVALLREEPDNPEVVLEYTKRIEAASQHLLGLINDVLDMNKIESGSASLNLSELNVAEVIDEINTIIRPQAKAKRQEFEIFVSSLAYEHFQGDKLRINQVLINLLSNAVKYTPEGGRIEMRVEELPQVMEEYSRIRFTVSDNGMGMSREYQKIIFDPFTREESSAIRQIQGTGLGMAITKSLVDLMGGVIKVESELGKGSTFIVELELYIQEQEDDPRFWQEHKVKRMIVADDEEEVCRSIARTMEQTGVATDYSTDGQAAIEMMRAAREAGRPYDLILLDWKMPNLNGLETARLIREKYPEKIPILLLTAYDWGEIEQEAREIGVNHFMPKPFFLSTFKAAIRRVMGGLERDKEMKDSVVEGKHILVVDDIEVNRIILVKILQTLGATCETAGNGQEAVGKFEASQPGQYDMILMDVQMPVMDGYTATRAIRAGSHPEAGTVPIIAMTANAFVDDVRDAIESGMDAHVAKPIQVDKLKSTIRQVLENRAGK